MFARGPSPENTGKLTLAHATQPNPSIQVFSFFV
jgi:hypothetical protein